MYFWPFKKRNLTLLIISTSCKCPSVRDGKRMVSVSWKRRGAPAPLVWLFRNSMSRAVMLHCNTYSRTKWGRQNFQVKCEETMNAYLAEEGKLALLWLSRFSTSIESLNVTHFKKVNWELGRGKWKEKSPFPTMSLGRGGKTGTYVAFKNLHSNREQPVCVCRWHQVGLWYKSEKYFQESPTKKLTNIFN